MSRARIFVYEYLSGGGVVDDNPQATAALLPEGVAMRDALTADLMQSSDCDLSVATFDGASAVARGATALAAHRAEEPLEFVARQARRHDAVWVIAPETGGCLAALQRAVGDARWIGCDANAIALASSKAATVERLHARGVLTPRAEPFAGSERWVVKPDDGAGAVATRVHATHLSARTDFEQRTLAHMEPWVDGEAMSLSLLCGATGAELVSVNRQRIAVDRQGEVSYEGVEIDVLPRSDPRHRVLAALAHAVHNALPGLRGFVGIDLVWHPQHGPVAIEVNPRMTCAYVGLSQRLSRNLAAEVLREHAIV